MKANRPVALIILDGFGLSDSSKYNAISKANTPTVDWLWENCPHAVLSASGRDVGLMDGQMGDSNVGHLNIGAGRVVYQDVLRITKSIEDGEFFKNQQLLYAINHAKEFDSQLHLIGLLSPGGVHSHSEHLYALLLMAKEHGLTKVYIHAFLDGRDVPPTSAIDYLSELEEKLVEIGVGKIATISGRYYAMDRDKRWDRVEKAYLALTEGKGRIMGSSDAAIKLAYEQQETDEFVIPTVLGDAQNPTAKIENQDAVIFYNFRADRAREITWALTESEFDGFDRPGGKRDICLVTMTQYDENVNAPFAFPPQELNNTLGEYLSLQGLKQLRIAETEKYAHVTFFFNGGKETPFDGEDRKLIPSPKVATYDLKPEMSAPQVTEEVVASINSGKYHVIVLNYANCDMVGHTGQIGAAIKAVEAVDAGLGKVLAALKAQNGQAIITADHGNAEQMLDLDTNQPHTAHTTNQVPIWLFNTGREKIRSGVLGDLAPTVLDLLNLDKPAEMTGNSLIQE